MLGKIFQIHSLISSDDLAVTIVFPKGDLIFSSPLSNGDIHIILKPTYGCVHTALLSVLQQNYILETSIFFAESCCYVPDSIIYVLKKERKKKINSKLG